MKTYQFILIMIVCGIQLIMLFCFGFNIQDMISAQSDRVNTACGYVFGNE